MADATANQRCAAYETASLNLLRSYAASVPNRMAGGIIQQAEPPIEVALYTDMIMRVFRSTSRDSGLGSAASTTNGSSPAVALSSLCDCAVEIGSTSSTMNELGSAGASHRPHTAAYALAALLRVRRASKGPSLPSSAEGYTGFGASLYDKESESVYGQANRIVAAAVKALDDMGNTQSDQLTW